MFLGRLFCPVFGAVFFAALGVALFHNAALASPVLICAVFLICLKLPPGRYFPLALFSLFLLGRLAVILLADVAPVSDFAMMLESARRLLGGDMGFAANSYYRLWPYQLPFTVYQAALLSVWDNILLLKIANAVFMSAGGLLIYLIAKEASGERAGRCASLVYLLLPFPLSLAPVLTNQHIGAFLLLLAVWLFMAERFRRLGIWRYALSGAALAAGNLMRPEGIVVLTSFVAFSVFSAVGHHDRKLRGRLFSGVAALLACYVALMLLSSSAVKTAGLHEKGLSNQNPMWKFVLGLNHDTGGGYSGDDAAKAGAIFAKYGAGDELFAFERRLVRERLAVPPSRLALLTLRKIRCIWVESDLSLGFRGLREVESVLSLSNFTLSGAKLYDMLKKLDEGLRVCLTLLCLFGLFSVFRKGAGDLRVLIAPFAMLACFCVFLLIEVQGRYAYLPQMFVAITAAMGMEEIFNATDRYRQTAHETDFDRRPLL